MDGMAISAHTVSVPLLQFELQRLGRMSYAEALRVQLSLVERVRRGDSQGALVVVEHNPVITMGAGTKPGNLLAPEARLKELGVEVTKTDRGGDVTYHGPGQVVVYPVLNLRAMRMDVHSYLRGLEQTVIRTLSEYWLEGCRRGPAGVWVGERKVCSIGIAVRRGIAYHGLALNVAPNMQHFAYINPCGLDSARITCLAELLGRRLDMAEVVSRLEGNFAHVFNVRLVGGQ